RRVADRLQQLAHLVHAAVGGPVDLEDIEGMPLGDLAAGVALAAGVRRRSSEAVERLGEDAGEGGLAYATDAGEDIAVGDPGFPQGVRERCDGRFLADDLVEGLRTV